MLDLETRITDMGYSTLTAISYKAKGYSIVIYDDKEYLTEISILAKEWDEFLLREQRDLEDRGYSNLVEVLKDYIEQDFKYIEEYSEYYKIKELNKVPEDLQEIYKEYMNFVEGYKRRINYGNLLDGGWRLKEYNKYVEVIGNHSKLLNRLINR